MKLQSNMPSPHNLTVKSNTKNSATLSFGYNYETHKFITEKAIEYVPKLKQTISKMAQNTAVVEPFLHFQSTGEFFSFLLKNPSEYKKTIVKLALNPEGLEKFVPKATKSAKSAEEFVADIANSAMLPDLLKKESGFYTNRHFYFPSDGHSNNSFGIGSEFSNAFISFTEHIRGSRDLKSPRENPFREIGMASHFLQDMTMPMHTQRSQFKIFDHFPFAGKAVDFFMHKNFESSAKQGILGRQEALAKKYSPNYNQLKESVRPDRFFDDLFINNVKFSTQPQRQVKRTNKSDWANIQQQCFNQAVDSTVVLLQDFEKRLSLIL